MAGRKTARGRRIVIVVFSAGRVAGAFIFRRPIAVDAWRKVPNTFIPPVPPAWISISMLTFGIVATVLHRGATPGWTNIAGIEYDCRPRSSGRHVFFRVDECGLFSLKLSA